MEELIKYLKSQNEAISTLYKQMDKLSKTMEELAELQAEEAELMVSLLRKIDEEVRKEEVRSTQ